MLFLMSSTFQDIICRYVVKRMTSYDYKGFSGWGLFQNKMFFYAPLSLTFTYEIIIELGFFFWRSVGVGGGCTGCGGSGASGGGAVAGGGADIFDGLRESRHRVNARQMVVDCCLARMR